MTSHIERSIALADKITARAEAAVSSLDREIVDWPAEFQAVMWAAVAAVASSREKAAREAHADQTTPPKVI